jgi:hypothetical protein
MADIAKTWFFQSNSNPNKMYETTQYTDGSTSCQCHGWTMKKPGKERTCTHTRQVEAGLADRNCVRSLDKQLPTARNIAVKEQRPVKQVKAKPEQGQTVKARKIVW